MKPIAERVQELANRLMDGTLLPAEERELGEALRESREARELMQAYFRLEGAMTELARVQLVSRSGESGPKPETPKRRRVGTRVIPLASGSVLPRRTSWGAGLLAASVLLGLLYVAVRQEESPSLPASGSLSRNLPPRGDAGPIAPTFPKAAP